MVLVLCSLFILLVGLHIHQYSLPCWGHYIHEEEHAGVLLGTPQEIRSDDWAVEIPLMLSQLSHKPPFPVINSNIGIGANQLAPLKLPVWHVLAIFKPTTWGFFLGADTGLAWMWWSMVLGFFYSFFLLFMLISRNRFFLSIMGSLFLLFSPFFQFWSLHGSEIPIFMALTFISFAYLAFSSDKRIILASGVLLGWFSGCFMLNFIYPPIQVPLAHLLVFLTGGFVASRYSELHFRQAVVVRLSGFGMSLAIVTLAVAVFYIDTREVITILQNTVYPGKRISTGGDFEFWKLFSNNFFIHLYAFFQHGVEAASLAKWGATGNICEYASFIFFFPALLLAVITRCALARKAVDPLSLALGGYIIIVLVYLFLGFPEWLSRLTGFSLVPSFRGPMGLGIADTALLVAVLSKPAYFELPKIIKIIIATLLAALLLSSAIDLFAKWPLAPIAFLMAASVAVALAFYFLLSARFSRTALAVLVGLSILSTGWFNPIVRGGSDIFSNSTLGRAILEADARQGATSRWAAFMGFGALANIFRILGVNSLNGVYPYPQFDLWKKLDPFGKVVDVYNRYGFATFVPCLDSDVAFFAPNPASFMIGINPSSQVLRNLGVTHCLVMGMDTRPFDRSPVLQRIFSSENVSLYKVVSPGQ